MIKQSTINSLLCNHTLFAECSPSLIGMIEKNARLCEYAIGDTLKGYDDRPFLCIIWTGQAAVHTRDEKNDLLLRILCPGDTFGVANLFAHTDMITRVTAEKPTVALCIGEETIHHALLTDGHLAIRYISFLSDRVRFLNRRIATLSAGNAERRLAAWLDTMTPETSSELKLSMPMNQLADTLGVGRASLYRAFDELIAAGYLIRNGKTVSWLDRSVMRQNFDLC